MIDLGYGTVYLTENEPLPFGCPVCGSPVAYSRKQVVACPCGFVDDRNAFLDVEWQLALVN